MPVKRKKTTNILCYSWCLLWQLIFSAVEKQERPLMCLTFLYLCQLKSSLPRGIEAKTFPCYQVQKQALTDKTSMNWGNTRYRLPVTLSCSLTSLDTMSKTVHVPVMKHDIHLISQTLIMILTLSKMQFHLFHFESMTSCFHGWHDYRLLKKNLTQRRGGQTRGSESCRLASIQPDENWSWKSKTITWMATQAFVVFRERTWLIIFVEIFFSSKINSWGY